MTRFDFLPKGDDSGEWCDDGDPMVMVVGEVVVFMVVGAPCGDLFTGLISDRRRR